MQEVTSSYPAGKYYIGDICYALSSTVYELQWGDIHKYNPGTFEIKYKGNVGKFSVNHTKYGDGVYLDTSKGLEFIVDAGVIGIVPLDLCNPKNINKQGIIEGGHIIESTTPVEFSSHDGIFVVSFNNNTDMIVLDTCDIEDDEDECDDSASDSDL